MDSQSKLLSDQAAFITSPKTSLANYWGGHCPPAPQCLRACTLKSSFLHLKSNRVIAVTLRLKLLAEGTVIADEQQN